MTTPITPNPTSFPNPNYVAGTSANNSSGPAGAGTSVAGTSLGGTDFLTLMLAQLKNQDPTSPADSNTFLSQLASLSQVQGITKLNTSFSALSGSLVSNQAMQASSLLGHQALVASPTANLSASGAVTGAVQIPQTTSDAVLNISDSSGALVRQIDLGAQSGGMANYTWDGKQTDGSQAAPGTYTLKALYADAASNKGATAATTYVNGTVQSVTMGAGAAGLTLSVSGLGSVPFSNVTQISN